MQVRFLVSEILFLTREDRRSETGNGSAWLWQTASTDLLFGKISLF
jgi:hypothetical protein